MARTIRQSDFEKKDFVPQELIEKWTRSVDIKEEQNNQNNRKGFNPRNYLNKFDDAITQIRTLRNEVDEAIAKHTESARTEESQYKSDLRGFVDDLSNVMHEFRNLDGKISKVSHTAIKIGDRLENVEEQRQQILDSEELIEHFLRFNKKEEFREIDPIFFAESGDSLYKAARLIIKLKDISQDLAFGETENAKKEINKISDRIKQNLTDEFIRAFRAKREDNHKEMKECATILDEFHDQSVKEKFLNLYLGDVDFNAYPSTCFSEVNKSIVQFTNDLSRVIETACKSIVRVFPKPELVIKELVEKVFRDQILKYLMNATQPILLGNQLGGMGINLGGIGISTSIVEDEEDNKSSGNVFGNILSADILGGGGGGSSLERSTGLRSTGMNMNGNGGPLGALGMNMNVPFASTVSTGNSISGPLVNVNDTGGINNLNKLSKKELDEYLSIINIVYKNTNNLLQDLKHKVLEIVFDLNKDDEDAKREKLYSVGHILEEDKLLKIVFEQHQQNYLKLEIKHLKNALKELIKEHVIEPLGLEDTDLSDDDWEPQTSSSLNHTEDSMQSPFDITVTNVESTPEHPIQSEQQTSKNKTRFGLSAFKNKTPIGSGRKLTSQLMQKTQQYSQKKLKNIRKAVLPKGMSSKEFEEMMNKLRNVFQFGINVCVGSMKKKVASSLTRCKNISSPKELSENIHKVFLVYLDAVDTLFRKTLIPICKETLPKRGSKEMKHWEFLESVHHTNSALQLVEQCWINDVAPSITDNFEYSICKEDKNRVYSDFEQDILSGLRELLTCALDIVATVLKKDQQKSDFKPKQDDVENLGQTSACRNACNFIDQFRQRTLICLDGRNLDRFFLVLGTRLYYNIIEHFKDIKQYNRTGAMILVQDAKSYQSTVNKFHIEKINELFLTLVERTNLISIPADSIVPYIENDAKLSKIDKSELKQWLKLRNDYRSSKIESKLFD